MGALPLAKLPETREAYDTELRAKGITEYKAGYLPNSIVDGWQQIRKDFAYWRALTLLLATLAQVDPRYQLEKAGDFGRGDPRGVAFASARLAAGATALRHMIVDAWLNSAQTPVGYPMVNVRDIESAKVRAPRD